MAGERPRKVHVDGLLSVYRIWGISRLDKTTVLSTFNVNAELTDAVFSFCVDEGYLREISADTYELTPKGDAKIDSMLVRRGSIRVLNPGTSH
jgi:predicted transcriptional regulator